MSERLGDAPIEDAYRENMVAIARVLDEQIKRFEGQPEMKGRA